MLRKDGIGHNSDSEQIVKSFSIHSIERLATDLEGYRYGQEISYILRLEIGEIGDRRDRNKTGSIAATRAGDPSLSAVSY